MLGWNLVFASSRAPVSDLVRADVCQQQISRARGRCPGRGPPRARLWPPFPAVSISTLLPPLLFPSSGWPPPPRGRWNCAASPTAVPSAGPPPLPLFYHLPVLPSKSWRRPIVSKFSASEPAVETWTPLSKSGGGPIKLVRQKKKKTLSGIGRPDLHQHFLIHEDVTPRPSI